MNLEDLNKTQIILLTLLVSFVSAIATSIFTVKLLEEAPPAVTQTINRVVERTIERVVPAEPTETGAVEQTVIEKETTVVVKEEDLITDSIEKNKRKIVRLVTVLPNDEPAIEGTTTPEVAPSYVFHGIGVIVKSDGLVVTASQVADVGELVALTPDGVLHEVSVVQSDDTLALIQIEPLTEDDTLALSTATFADENALRLGQTVIALGGEDRTSVSMGIIASLIEGDVVEGETTTSKLLSVQTNIAGSIPGSPLVNIFGEIVGIDLEGTPGLYTASSVVKSVIAVSQSPAGEELGETAEDTPETLES